MAPSHSNPFGQLAWLEHLPGITTAVPDGEPGLGAFRDVEIVAGLDQVRPEDVSVTGQEIVDQWVVQVVYLFIVCLFC